MFVKRFHLIKIPRVLYFLIIFIVIILVFIDNLPHVFASSTACTGENLNDNFEGSTYPLDGGQVSPNGKWQNVYSGSGSTGVNDSGGTNVFYLSPKIVQTSNDTQASLVKSTATFCNFVLNFDIKTVKQLRQNSAPNPWEVGWIIFRYTDEFHYYWFRIATDGINLGKKDCDTCSNSVDGQEFLVTKDNPTLNLNSWIHWRINAFGNHFQIFADQNKLVDYIDNNMSSKLSSGNIAMYSEDAYVLYDNIKVNPR
jgi:hypothetical protein